MNYINLIFIAVLTMFMVGCDGHSDTSSGGGTTVVINGDVGDNTDSSTDSSSEGEASTATAEQYAVVQALCDAAASTAGITTHSVRTATDAEIAAGSSVFGLVCSDGVGDILDI